MNGRPMADAARVTHPELMVLYKIICAESAAPTHGYIDPGMHVLIKSVATKPLADVCRAEAPVPQRRRQIHRPPLDHL